MALVAHYKLNKNGNDFSGNSFNMTSLNNITYTAGVVGRSAHFNGTNSYMRTNSNVTTTTNRMTVAAWFKVESGGSNYRCALHKATATSVGSSEFWIGVSAAQNITATIGANSGVGWDAGETNIQRVEGQWVHALATWDGSVVKVYVNGVFNKQYTLTSLTIITDPTRIGASSDGSSYQFSGDVDEVRVYDEDFSKEQVTELYNSRPETITFSQNKLTSKIITSHNNKTIVPFTTVGSTNWTVPAGVTKIDALIVAGGGGGGKRHGGGGGAGGALFKKNIPVNPGDSIPIVVGNGGLGAGTGSSPTPAENGNNSSVLSYTAIGGGRGGGYNQNGEGASGQYFNGADGGSGGGGATNSGIGGSGIQFQGYSGGSCDTASWPGAGGGGAAGIGQDNDGTLGGNGGPGKYMGTSFGITYGENGYFAGGGGGAGQETGQQGLGGVGGGADGSAVDDLPNHATPNTGGGGGGVRSSTSTADITGGNGGSGIVLIKYSTSNINSKITN